MTRSNAAPGFWLRHLLWPLLGFLLGMLVIHLFRLDLRLADVLYALEGGQWSLRTNFIIATVLHHDAQRFSELLGLLTLIAGAASLCWQPLRIYRRGFFCVIAAMLFSLLLVALSKHYLPIPCPWAMQRYGGTLLLAGWLHYQWNVPNVSGCYPSGHAAGGFCLLAWYFFARHYHFRRAPLYLLPGLLLGLLFGATQQLRGAHFISHDLSAVALCWFFSLVCYRLILVDHPVERTLSA